MKVSELIAVLQEQAGNDDPIVVIWVTVDRHDRWCEITGAGARRDKSAVMLAYDAGPEA